jgi:hypothetical protein
MEKVEFDPKTKVNVVDLVRAITELQARLRAICQTVIYMHNGNPDDYTLTPDLNGLVKVKKEDTPDVSDS